MVFSATLVLVAQQSPGAADPLREPFTAKYCVGCHSDRTKTGGLSLEGLTLTDIPARGELWEKVLRKLRSGEMPPASVRIRPDAATHAAFVSFLETTLDRAAAADPNPGRAPAHRLNRAEYSNAIRDLLAVDVKPGNWLPVDDSGYGFDNIAAVLSTSPVLLERYMAAARKISRLAIGDSSLKPGEETFEAPRDPETGPRNEQLNQDLPFGSRAGLSVPSLFSGRRPVHDRSPFFRRCVERSERRDRHPGSRSVFGKGVRARGVAHRRGPPRLGTVSSLKWKRLRDPGGPRPAEKARVAG